jgi:hypothetical protein
VEAGRWTTHDLLATEAHALEQASLLRAARDPGTDAAVIAAVLEEEQILNAEQSAMVAHLTADGGRLRMVVGPAGSGKTAALALAHRIWRAQGRYVRGVTLSAIAARGLNQATFISAPPSRPRSTSSKPDQSGRGRTSPAARSSSSTKPRWSAPGTWPDSWQTPSSTR